MTIIQADRDAASRFIAESDGDHPELAALFAAHREAAEARAKLEGAKAMQTKAVEVAAWSHMVPPDGGSPSEDECAVARAAADAIAALDPAQIVKDKP